MSPFSKQVAEHRDNKQIDEIRKQASQWQPERRVLSDVLYHWRGSLWQHHQQSKDYPDAGWSGHPDSDFHIFLSDSLQLVLETHVWQRILLNMRFLHFGADDTKL